MRIARSNACLEDEPEYDQEIQQVLTANCARNRLRAAIRPEIARLREQAEALAAAVDGILRAIGAHHPKFAQGPFTLTREEIEACRAALRAFREASHES